MKIGIWLENLDKAYYHRHHYPLGFIFCDLLDYYYGMSASQLLKERQERSGRLAAVALLGPLAALKVGNLRVKWDWKNAVRHRRVPLAPSEEEWGEDVLDRESALLRAYGKTSWELAEEAEQGYDLAKMKLRAEHVGNDPT